MGQLKGTREEIAVKFVQMTGFDGTSWLLHSSFPVVHKVDNVDISVLLKFEIR